MKEEKREGTQWRVDNHSSKKRQRKKARINGGGTWGICFTATQRGGETSRSTGIQGSKSLTWETRIRDIFIYLGIITEIKKEIGN